jgi:hypothetical protein
MSLSRKEKITGYIAKSLVLLAARINATAVLSLGIETARIYNERRGK